MAGAAKNRSRKEEHPGSSGPPSTGPSTRSTAKTSERSSPRPIGARYDGPKGGPGAVLQPGQHNVDIRNLELSFGMLEAARGGVS